MNNSLIPNSNIADLVNDVLRFRKHMADPVGWKEFALQLQEMNIPQEYVGNQNRLAFIKGEQWDNRPPGSPEVKFNVDE